MTVFAHLAMYMYVMPKGLMDCHLVYHTTPQYFFENFYAFFTSIQCQVLKEHLCN